MFTDTLRSHGMVNFDLNRKIRKITKLTFNLTN